MTSGATGGCGGTWPTSGVLGLVVPEQYDGAGLGFFEFALALIEQGRRVCHVPLWETVVFGALPLARYGDEKQRRHWLPADRRWRCDSHRRSGDPRPRPARTRRPYAPPAGMGRGS